MKKRASLFVRTIVSGTHGKNRLESIYNNSKVVGGASRRRGRTQLLLYVTLLLTGLNHSLDVIENSIDSKGKEKTYIAELPLLCNS